MSSEILSISKVINTSFNNRFDMSSEQVDMKEIQKQLSRVVDPEIGIPIVEMNLIDKLDIKDGNIDVQYHATTPYCPPIFALKISQDIKNYLLQVKGVNDVRVVVTGHYLADAVNKQVNKPQVSQSQR
jgi:metal-sulfur cluster biosynthetic enzyme